MTHYFISLALGMVDMKQKNLHLLAFSSLCCSNFLLFSLLCFLFFSFLLFLLLHFLLHLLLHFLLLVIIITVIVIQ